MESHKLNTIKNLKHEVKDFHPLLHSLFPKLPNITGIEYNQGPNEMGADFVLTKCDDTLDDIEYVGCIVKVGQIKQDHAEIHRQIEECEIERTIQGGKRKIFINEIWIISNGNITKGAQDKIHHRYKNKNIKFLPIEKITKLVDTYYPQFWSDVTVQTGEYLREIKSTADNISKNNSLIDTSKNNIYITQQIIRLKPQNNLFEETKKPPAKTTLEFALQKEDFIIVEALMGTGKSMLIAELAKSYADPEVFHNEKVLPFLLSAAELLKNSAGDVREIVEATLSRDGFDSVEKKLVFIDGLDELKIDNETRLKFLQKIYQSSNTLENIKVVITTRPIDEPEIETEIEKHFARYRLCSLSIKQVLALVSKICTSSEANDRVIKDLDKSHLFKVLPKTPISAILLAKLLNENIQEIPSTMTDLYNKFMELSLGRWDMNKGLQSQQEYDVINNVTIDIANFIMQNSLTEISIGDTKQIFDDYIDSRNLNNIEKDTIFTKLINKQEIYAQNKAKNTIRFRHRTFAEYFYATGLNRDHKAVISESIYDVYWSNSYFFYIGLRRDCPEILKAINNIKFSQEEYRVLKIFNNGNFLLAAYLTPYDNIKELVIDSFNHASQFYAEIVSEESNSPLKQIPAMQLLYILTETLCESFGYEFFTPFITEHAYDLCTHPNLSETQYVELFLLNSVQVTLNQPKTYDSMIENYGKHIPLQVQAGILEHSENNKSNSNVVKKYVKNFRKKVKNNPSVQKILIDLYQEPINNLSIKGIK
jgi:NACHT conflict system protein/NACHT domain-containing protein